MDFNSIKKLIQLVKDNDLASIKIEEKDIKIEITQKGSTTTPILQAPIATTPTNVVAPTTPTESTTTENTGNLTTIKAPMVGTFYRSANPETPPFVKVGDIIKKGDVLCIIEAMKLFNEIQSEVSGKVVKVMLDNAQAVEYDQALFLIEPK
ncbi:MAG: acetyl-CoA carboxylase biotin carboxyl carrier protein [Chitinophagales bacterium]|nr:acetyl-CoA carboxylase biotin carboxyl carrier protein [Chitinophagales bacterium]